MVETVAWLAGDPDYVRDLRAEYRRQFQYERPNKSVVLFEWLAAAMNYQGISDQVARQYMAQHGRPRWHKIKADLAQGPSCQKLRSFWHFHDCRYRKLQYNCSEPFHLECCPLPAYPFRNGNLNQLAFSLFLFIRDVADGDLAGWINNRIVEADPLGPADLDGMGESVVSALKGVHGVSDKILNMVFADLLLAAGADRPVWTQVGAAMVAIDTLVHNFLHRTGILARAGAEHPYGPMCYGQVGCAAILRAISKETDARQFDPEFPAYFPRYIQRAIWAFCAIDGLEVCNGRNIDDRMSCRFVECRLNSRCDRVPLQ
jgi:hypothetical protein